MLMYTRREKNKNIFLIILLCANFGNTIICYISEGGNTFSISSWLHCSLKIFQINNKRNKNFNAKVSKRLNIVFTQEKFRFHYFMLSFEHTSKRYEKC